VNDPLAWANSASKRNNIMTGRQAIKLVGSWGDNKRAGGDGGLWALALNAPPGVILKCPLPLRPFHQVLIVQMPPATLDCFPELGTDLVVAPWHPRRGPHRASR
jgi:hypothetical protein